MTTQEMIMQFTMLAFSLIATATPVDTRNLLNNTTYSINGNKAKIVISAPKATKDGMTNYATYVNYNPQRSAKERKNYHYVENSLIQACKIFADKVGGVFVNEL